MRLTHISDLHFTTFFRTNNLFQIERALRHAIDLQSDHIVITGDLTDNAVPKDFLILRKLFEKLDLIDGNRFSLVIGNHDIFGGAQSAEDIFTFPVKCSNTNYNQKVREFYNYFPELFDSCLYLNNKNVFPFAKLINNFLLIGWNSIEQYSKINNPFASNGKIEISQLNETFRLFEKYQDKNYRKIVLVHHHFNKIEVKDNSSNKFWQKIEKQTMKLKKKKRLLKFFNQFGVELVLHGHYHVSNDYTRKGIRFSNAGASLKGDVNGNSYLNVIDINDDTINIKVEEIPNVKGIEIFNNDFAYQNIYDEEFLKLELSE
ncbi:MAG: metallophosphoesterase [Bacteroidetes bacterium]|nr:metallophosphoesterase [Bacteroidota bacterium]